MLKKMLSLLTVLMLAMLSVPAMAADNGADPLDLEELSAWFEGVRAQALESQPLNDPHAAEAKAEDGAYRFDYSFGTVYFASPDPDESTVLTAVVLSDIGQTAPHGVKVGMSVDAVLAAFYNENETLTGTREMAVIYLTRELPFRATSGIVLRDGQRVEGVQYAVYEQSATGGDGYTAAGMLCTIEDGLVSAIRVYGLDENRPEHEVEEELETVARVQAQTAYARVKSSVVGSELTMFAEADLSFSGVDAVSLTPESAAAALGKPLEDVWMDDEGGFIRIMDFAQCEVTFSYGADKVTPRLRTIAVTTDGLEGPRAVRVGDSLSSVMCRFRFGEGDYEGMTEILYGKVGQAPYATAEYAMNASAVLRYETPVSDGRSAVLLITFDQLAVSEYLVYFVE